MKKTCILLIFGLALLLSVSAQTFAAGAAPVSTVTVQGSAHLDVIPDQAMVTIGVVTTAPTAAEARQDNAAIALSIQQKLLGLGIAEDNIRTSQYTFNPVYSSDTDRSGLKTPVITGYRVNNTVAVLADNIDSVGTVIDTALAAGANQISGIRFQKKAEEQLKQAVLKGAVREATIKAEAIATALGKHLGQPLTVTENGVFVQAPEIGRALFKADSANVTPVAAGTVQVNGSVSIIFELL